MFGIQTLRSLIGATTQDAPETPVHVNADVIYTAPSGAVYFGVVDKIDVIDGEAFIHYYVPAVEDWSTAWRPIDSLRVWSANLANELNVYADVA